MFHLVFKAMGVYLYGELMVQEDTRQQALASRCLSLVQEEMDQSARRVVEEMVLWLKVKSHFPNRQNGVELTSVSLKNVTNIWKCISSCTSRQLTGINLSHFLCFWCVMSGVFWWWVSPGRGGSPRLHNSVTCASHSCLSSLTMQVWRPRKGPFPWLHSSLVRVRLSEKEFGSVFLKQTRGKKGENASARALRGLEWSRLLLHCLEFPPVGVFKTVSLWTLQSSDLLAWHWMQERENEHKQETGVKAGLSETTNPGVLLLLA